jgi:hypothetical protein
MELYMSLFHVQCASNRWVNSSLGCWGVDVMTFGRLGHSARWKTSTWYYEVPRPCFLVPRGGTAIVYVRSGGEGGKRWPCCAGVPVCAGVEPQSSWWCLCPTRGSAFSDSRPRHLFRFSTWRPWHANLPQGCQGKLLTGHEIGHVLFRWIAASHTCMLAVYHGD